MHVDTNFDELYHRLVELIICQVGSTVDYMLHNNNNTHSSLSVLIFLSGGSAGVSVSGS